MSEGDDNLTVALLREIRDELRGTNQRVDGTNERLDRTNERLEHVEGRLESVEGRMDHLVEGQIRLATEVTGLRGEVRQQGARLEHALMTGGQVVQGLRTRIERIEKHVGLKPSLE